MRVFFIGNGFDSGVHSIKSRYIDFKEYLKKKNPNLLGILEILYDDSRLWCDFENELGYPKRESFNAYYAMNSNDFVIKELQNAFAEWTLVLNEQITNIQPKINNIKTDDKFLVFNYTNTLEEVYRIEKKQVCHIHGQCWMALFGYKNSIVFGHTKMPTTGEYKLDKFIEKSEKDTEKCYLNNKEFFDSLCNINQIVSIGVSFGKVDDLYFKKIIQKTNNNTIWYLSPYEYDNELVAKTKRIRDLGFNGNVEKFKDLI